MSLRRVFAVFLLALFGISAMTLFQVSQAVQHQERILATKKFALKQAKENKRVLEAEWAYLNRPERLENLARNVLDLNQLSIENVTGQVNAVPEPFSPSLPIANPLRRIELRNNTDSDAAHPAQPSQSPTDINYNTPPNTEKGTR
jgi:hypothetical protein